MKQGNMVNTFATIIELTQAEDSIWSSPTVQSATVLGQIKEHTFCSKRYQKHKNVR